MKVGNLIKLKKRWYLYVVECADGKLYTGITTNVKRRINEHNYSDKAAKYTRARRPVRLRMTREYATHSEAAMEEWKFKKMNRKQKLGVINESR